MPFVLTGDVASFVFALNRSMRPNNQPFVLQGWLDQAETSHFDDVPEDAKWEPCYFTLEKDNARGTLHM